MNLSGTTHLKLESWPASRNFPDSANLEDKKGTLCDHSCFTFRLHSCPNFLEAERNFFIIFNLGMLNETRRRRMRNHVARLSLLVCMRLYGFLYINLINLYRFLPENFHHQDLFSLNLDLVYGGIMTADWSGSPSLAYHNSTYSEVKTATFASDGTGSWFPSRS